MRLQNKVAVIPQMIASDDSAYTTGQIVEVSGGFGMPTPVYGDMIEMKNSR